MAIYNQYEVIKIKEENGNEIILNPIYCKTHINGYFFDAILNVNYSSELTITSHPVEDGSSVTDHAYMEPNTLSMDIGMSDSCMSYIEGQFQQKYTRSVSAYDTLRMLQQERIPLMINTRLRIYENMLIQSISVSDDHSSLNGLKCSVSMVEIMVAKAKTVSIENATSEDPDKTANTIEKGTVNVNYIELITNENNELNKN